MVAAPRFHLTVQGSGAGQANSTRLTVRISVALHAVLLNDNGVNFLDNCWDYNGWASELAGVA